MSQKALGKHFRKGISLIEITRMFPNDHVAEAWFEKQRWGAVGKPSTCPICSKSGKISSVPSRKPLPYWCGSCRRNFSVKTNSVMHRSHIGYQKWAMAIYLWTTTLKGVSSMKLHRDLEITQKSAYFMAQRLRKAWDVSGLEKMIGPAEADETYMGGKRRNMSNAKRKTQTGQGAVGKVAVAGIKDRKSNRVVANVVGSTEKDTLQGFIKDNVETGSELYTDEHASYPGIDGYSHKSVRHSCNEYVKGVVHTNGVESFWAMFKRAHKGTYHKMSLKYLQRYVDEFTTRHNLRSSDTAKMMQDTVAMMDGKRLTYADLIADSGLESGARK